MKKWTNKEIKAVAKRFKTSKEWIQKNNAAYKAAQRRGLLKECTKHMKPLHNKPYTKKQLIVIAKKFKTRSEWNANHSGSYTVARRLGLLEECCKHMQVLCRKLSDREIINIAKRFATSREWERNDAGSYSTAKVRGIIKECTKHMIQRSKKVLCIQTGVTYNSVKECADVMGVHSNEIKRASETNKTVQGLNFIIEEK